MRTDPRRALRLARLLALGLGIALSVAAETPDLITFFPDPYGPTGITTGPDGNLWITEGLDRISRMTPSGQLTTFPLPRTCQEGFPSFCGAASIVTGPDLRLWFTKTRDIFGSLETITTNGVFATPSLAAIGPTSAIAVGSDDNIWTAIWGYANENRIYRTTTSGATTTFSFAPGVNAGVQAAALGPDGNVWLSESGRRYVAKVTPSGLVTEYPIPPTLGASYGITAGPDGAIWLTFNSLKTAIGRMTTDGVLRSYPIPNGVRSEAICLGPDGNLWFADAYFIGRCTPAGEIVEVPLPPGARTNGGITAGPDGKIWFTVAGSGLLAVGRLDPVAVPAVRDVPALDVIGLVALFVALVAAGLRYAQKT